MLEHIKTHYPQLLKPENKKELEEYINEIA